MVYIFDTAQKVEISTERINSPKKQIIGKYFEYIVPQEIEKKLPKFIEDFLNEKINQHYETE